MAGEQQLTMPVLGMTCANCVATVERNVKKIKGVSDAAVNFSTEKVTVSYDPAQVRPQAMIERVVNADYRHDLRQLHQYRRTHFK